MPASRSIVAAALAALAVHPAFAAPGAAPEPPRAFAHDYAFDAREMAARAQEFSRAVQARTHEMVAQLQHDLLVDGDPAALAFVAGEMGGTREIVKNAPYSAEAVTETVQVLADGNRIVRQSRTLLARDGLGRTRQEKTGAGGGTVYLFDPIDNRSYALHPDRKVAVRLPRVPAPPVPPVPPVPGVAPPAPPTPPAVAPVPPVPPVPPASSRGSAVEVAPGHVVVRRTDGDGRDVRVEVVRVARGDGVAVAPPTMLTLPVVPRGKGETKSLGTRDFDGVAATGTMTTHTIPAGTIGNEKPIVVTSERWFAPDLHVVVFARTSDPRAGETTYRLANLRRGEPPADLFKVPGDYKGAGRRGD